MDLLACKESAVKRACKENMVNQVFKTAQQIDSSIINNKTFPPFRILIERFEGAAR